MNGIYGKKILDKKKIMKIFVLGSKGMLGRYVTKYLGHYYDVVEINRDVIDASDTTENDIELNLIRSGMKENDVVINCIGTIKPRVDELGDLNAIIVNSVFPRMLANVCKKNKSHLIHPTTDCVYSGLRGSYNEKDKYDVSDVYGMSKAMGEPSNCTVIRTSIIGEEVGQGRSLVEWVKSNIDKTVFGYTNHLWNGMTCLEFAMICKQIIDYGTFWEGTRHIHSNTLNKKELVETISKIYDLNITVNPKETSVKCDRTLATNFDLSIFYIPSLEEQIKQMKEFSYNLYN